MRRSVLLTLSACSVGMILSCETVGDVLISDSGAGGSTGGSAGENSGGSGTGGSAGENSGGSGTGGEDAGSSPYVGVPSDLTAGDAQTCFIDAGRLFCFGRGQEGQLGTGQDGDEPIAVRSGENDDYVLVRSGGRFTCALRSGGELECTGVGESGALGDGERTDRLDFAPVLLDQRIAHVSTGQAHACAITSAGALYCWGKNTEGQLGLGDPFPGDGVDRDEPVQVEPGRTFRDVSAGQGHTCAVDDDGLLLCWGRNTQNQLGLGDAADDQLRTAQQVGEDTDWIRVAAGQDHSCALKTTGALYCWGWNGAGQLGLGDREDRDRPALLTPSGIIDFDLDTFHTCVVRNEGAFCSGRGIEGSLGTGTSSDQTTLTLAPSTEATVQVAVGRFHTCIREPDTIRCTGENGDGRLGVTDLERRSSFTQITSPAL